MKIFEKTKEWFKSMNLFHKKTKKVVEQTTVEEKKQVFHSVRNPKIPGHNNRKRTPARIIQEIRMGGYSRFIYHNA